jgi:type II secretory pathway pseudopilin PulG
MTTPHWMQRVCHRIGCDAKDTRDAGFTLVEVLVSFVLFMVVSAGAATGVVTALNASHSSQQRVDAANVAQAFVTQAIQNAIRISPSAGETVSNVGRSDEKFTVTRWITFDSGDTCHPGTLFTVNIEVRQSQTAKFLARSDARVACPPA